MRLDVALLLGDAREQIKSNARLRLGLGVVLLVLWLYAILAAQDAVDALRAESAQLATRTGETRALAKQTAWPDRVKVAERQLESVRALMWAESEQGLAEARMQDWVSALAAKSGVVLRESALMRGDPQARFETATETPTSLPAGYARIRLRVVADFNPSPVSVMLAELAQGDRMIKVERLRILTATRPALLEMELGALARVNPAVSRP